MSRFKVGDTVSFAIFGRFDSSGAIKTGKLVRITGIFRKKEYLIECESERGTRLFVRKKQGIYKSLETIKEPVSESEVQND
ncbi:hypothetical protein NSA24_00680 [Clostridioides mangenotii]|uniref:hypothetical protein n=1 Tax=Metaclostridioides mangenotii TaxID=1540 RepID=UPI002149C552|nr:hypothetical protein [Clostridioides mangenotii]MCR1953341.1 hypothetical protein [Clostridioides mangenotii]